MSKRKFGGKGRDQRGHQRGGHHGGDKRRGHFRPGNQNPRAPKTCPMCGAVVGDLGGHIRDKHDDAESHPV